MVPISSMSVSQPLPIVSGSLPGIPGSLRQSAITSTMLCSATSNSATTISAISVAGIGGSKAVP